MKNILPIVGAYLLIPGHLFLQTQLQDIVKSSGLQQIAFFYNANHTNRGCYYAIQGLTLHKASYKSVY